MKLTKEERQLRYSRTEARETFWSKHVKSEYCCPDCGDQDAHFEVHHIDRDPYNNSIENLVGLCHWCHRRRHRREEIADRLDEMETEFAALAD
ncbi:hypothetical protein GCM10009725_31210 [Aeromicrobium tamlense]